MTQIFDPTVVLQQWDPHHGPHYGPMGTPGGTAGFLWGTLWILLIVAVVAGVAYLLVREREPAPGRRKSESDADEPLAILERRYARGDIDEEEFERRRDRLVRN